MNSGCLNVDGTFAPPSLAIDELQIYDRFVDPSKLYLHPCGMTLSPSLSSLSSLHSIPAHSRVPLSLTYFIILLSVQYVPAPNITSDDGRHVNLTIEGSFYDQFILPSVCTIYQQINEDSPTMRPCTKYPFTHVFIFFVFYFLFFMDLFVCFESM